MNNDLDYYDSDPTTVIDLLSKLPQLRQRNLKVLEPCAGSGALAKKYKILTKNNIDMYDINPRNENIIQSNYMDLQCYHKYDLILTNFPFINENKFGFNQLLLKALSDIKPNGYVANLSRLTSLESRQRYDKIYSKKRPEIILIYSHRLKHQKDNKLIHSDKSFIWTVWHKDNSGFFSEETKIDWIY